MIHKPAGVVTARTDEINRTIMEDLKERHKNRSDAPDWDRLFPVGRLDKDTEGLILLTDDGRWGDSLMQPAMKVPKTYEFWVLGKLDATSVEQLKQGVVLKGQTKESKAEHAEILEVSAFEDVKEELLKLPLISFNPYAVQTVSKGRMTLTAGKKHQVKRMLRAVGCYVVYLKRIQIGNLSLPEDLAIGDFRAIKKENVMPSE